MATEPLALPVIVAQGFCHLHRGDGGLSVPALADAFGASRALGLLPFFALMIAGVWYALHVSYRRGEVLEEFTVDDARAHLIRHNPKGDTQEWEANRYWVTVHLHTKGGPVENYLTLRGGDREVEIGAFLDAEERLTLHDELQRALRSA